jgi:hypothetical protein
MIRKQTAVLCVGIFTCLAGLMASAEGTKISTLQEYNQALPLWGTAWGNGGSAISGFYPSFYTGFAIRSEYPERLEVRQSRGNQTRVTIILDEKTISDYSFDLEKRYQFYQNMISAGLIDVTPNGAAVIPHLDYFTQIIESKEYGVLNITQAVKQNQETPQSLYAKNLQLLKKLNPSRVFNLKINLKSEFLKWKSYLQNLVGNSQENIADSAQQTVIALNTLVWGRVNVVEAPSTEVISKLKSALKLINGNENDFLIAARDLFIAATANKYNFKVLDSNGAWVSPIQCQNLNECYLSYPEFTAIYPTGSVKSFVSDKFGNKIPKFASPGLWKFIDSNSSGAVDNIRTDNYYGWIPKIDYEGIGNGYHNPAVLFNHISRSVQDNLGIHPDQDKFWSVMRGGVSHGCSRLPAGHIWELRHILPVENSKMTKVYVFHHNPQDFDIYDVDGDGELEIMGVEYLISYDLAGTSDVARREGKDLEVNTGKKLDFYTKLYGAKNVFTVNPENQYVFSDPGLSMPSYFDLNKKSVSTRLTLKGQYKLYEQVYEKDKIQLYVTKSGSPDRKIVRLLGRVRGCAPSSDKNECGETSFDQEALSIAKGAVK